MTWEDLKAVVPENFKSEPLTEAQRKECFQMMFMGKRISFMILTKISRNYPPRDYNKLKASVEKAIDRLAKPGASYEEIYEPLLSSVFDRQKEGVGKWKLENNVWKTAKAKKNFSKARK